MKITFKQVELNYRHPFRISRGVRSKNTNLYVFVESDGLVGIGEVAPGSLAKCTASEAGDMLGKLDPDDIARWSIHEASQRCADMGIAPCAAAGLDIALWDLHAKRCRLPLHQVLGLGKGSVATSVTIGINTPEDTRNQAEELLVRTGAKYLKIKLGSPDGVDADKESYNAAVEAAARTSAGLRVDANGGWDLATAKMMLVWLAERNCSYVEQPMHHDNDDQLGELFANRPLPIYADESCYTSADVPGLAGKVDGVNLKLMKCGGLTEAMRIVATARACKLGTMIGCMGETSVAISAAASIASLFDHIDLDGNLLIDPDGATGATLIDGVVTPIDTPGHGAKPI